MLTEVRKNLKLIGYYFKFNLSAVMEYRASFLLQSFGMIINNASFIFFWWILFENKSSIGGYGFEDVMTLWALMSSSFGIAHITFGNLNQITRMIINGEIDTYLLQPKDPLINIISSKTIISAWGDFLYGIVLFVIIRGFHMGSFALFLLFCITGAIIFSSVMITANALTFYIGNSQGITRLVSEFTITFSIYPEGIFGGALRYLLYIGIPIGFLVYVPAYTINSFSISGVLKVLLAAIIWSLIAYGVFTKGLKRYESGNLIISKM